MTDYELSVMADQYVKKSEIFTQMRFYGFYAPDMTVTEFVEDLPVADVEEAKHGKINKKISDCTYRDKKGICLKNSGCGIRWWCLGEPCEDFTSKEEEKMVRGEAMNLIDNKETVNHPSHYAGKIECIDMMIELFGEEETASFCLCNAFKYLWRCKSKHNSPIEDIKKAKWYLDKYIELWENKQ